MAMTDDQQRRLQAIERELSAESPRLARNLSAMTRPKPRLRPLLLGLPVLLAGLTIVVCGASTGLVWLAALGTAIASGGTLLTFIISR